MRLYRLSLFGIRPLRTIKILYEFVKQKPGDCFYPHSGIYLSKAAISKKKNTTMQIEVFPSCNHHENLSVLRLLYHKNKIVKQKLFNKIIQWMLDHL